MINPQQLVTLLSSLNVKASDAFLKDVAEYQRFVYRRVVSAVKEIGLGRGGIISASTANLKLVANLEKDIAKIFLSKDYEQKLKQFLGTFDEATIYNNRYLKFLDSAFNEGKNIYSFILSSAKQLTLDSLTGAGLDVALINPVKNILNTNITTGASYGDLLAQLQREILGDPTNLGRYERYAKQITTDSLNQFSRNYLETATNDLGLEWYYYSGTTRQTTRPFCKERVNKYWHKSEVQAWADREWSGKIPGTNSSSIFIYAGGFNCNHQLIPVSEAAVPAEVRARIQT